MRYSSLLAIFLAGASVASAKSSSSLEVKPAIVTKTSQSTVPSLPAVADLGTIESEYADALLASSVVEKTRGGDGEVSLAERLKIGGYFSLWYILNIVYNSECIIFRWGRNALKLWLVLFSGSIYPRRSLDYHSSTFEYVNKPPLTPFCSRVVVSFNERKLSTRNTSTSYRHHSPWDRSNSSSDPSTL